MGKFLDKKEQVIDFKLTSYGKHMLSNGNLKPTYYAFFDDNVIYDGAYVNITESQSNIENRIKNETQYLEGQTLFQDVEVLPHGSEMSVDSESLITTKGGDEYRAVYYRGTETPTHYIPRKDIFRFEQMIGDAFLEANTQHIPAWKIISLRGAIHSIEMKETTFPEVAVEIPQINFDLNYTLKVKQTNNINFTGPEVINSDESFTGMSVFNSGEYIVLEKEDLTFYAEEINTILLNKNFEIEVFEISGSQQNAFQGEILLKKDFVKDFRSLNGNNITQDYINNLQLPHVTPNSNNVEYFFDIYKDGEINKTTACKAIETYNKDSYYIDIDFDCESDTENINYYDIYGPVTEPEICL